MSFVRTINITKFSRKKRRFHNCFTNFGDGISIFSHECAVEQNGTICKHIEKYYLSTVKTPILYCVFELDELNAFDTNTETPFSLSSSISETGDTCHIDIYNMTNKDGEKFTKKIVCIPNLQICDNDIHLEENMILDFLANARTAFPNN